MVKIIINYYFAQSYNIIYYSNMDNLIAKDRFLDSDQQPPPIDPNQDARAFADSLQEHWISVEVMKIRKPSVSSK
jgi:hypothetical protein